MDTPQGQPKKNVAQFIRKETHDLQLGKILIYQLNVTGFTIVMHKDGVAFRGTIPVLKRDGMTSLKKMFDRAIVHHEHLKKTWDAGIGQQSYLNEDEVDVMLTPIVIAEA